MIVAHVRGQGSYRLDEHAGEVWFGKLDARAKLAGVFVFIVVSALLTRVELVFASLAVALTMTVVSMLPLDHLAKMYIAALPFILLASVSVFLFGGWERGIEMWARTSACVLLLLVLAAGTESFDLFSGLRRFRVPAIITTLLMLTQRYIQLLSEELARMTIARKARGFTGGRNLLDRYGLRIVSYTAGMVLVRSIGRGDRIYEGLKGKGFNGELMPWKKSHITILDTSFVSGLVIVAMVLLTLQLGVIQ
jgi:cobalt/nickel transport system permease protein